MSWVATALSITSAAVAAPALLEGADGAQKIDLAECRPEDIGEIEFAVGALPQQEAGETDLSAGADDQIRIRQPGSIKMAGDGFGGDLLHSFRQCRLFRSHAAEQGANRVGDLLASAIGYGNVELQAVILGGGTLGCGNRAEHRLGEQGTAADCANAHTPAGDRGVTGKGGQLGLDRGQDARNFGRRPVEIIGGKDPQGHGGDAEIGTPCEDLVELVGAEIVEFSRLGDAQRASVAAIAVEDDADVARRRPASDIADKPPSV